MFAVVAVFVVGGVLVLLLLLLLPLLPLFRFRMLSCSFLLSLLLLVVVLSLGLLLCLLNLLPFLIKYIPLALIASFCLSSSVVSSSLSLLTDNVVLPLSSGLVLVVHLFQGMPFKFMNRFRQ